MSIVTDPEKVKEAVLYLDRLEDEIVGCLTPVNDLEVSKERIQYIYQKRLELIWEKVLITLDILNPLSHPRTPGIEEKSSK